MSDKKIIDEFFNLKNIALAGASKTNSKKFGNYLFAELAKKSFNIRLIHPEGGKIDGSQCYKAFSEMRSKPDGLIACIKNEKLPSLVDSAIEHGIKYIWFQQGSGTAIEFKKCADAGVKYIAGECMMMFAEPVASMHKFHRFIWKLIGKYPKS